MTRSEQKGLVRGDADVEEVHSGDADAEAVELDPRFAPLCAF